MFKSLFTISFILSFSQIAFSQQWLYGKWTGIGRETFDGKTWSMKLTAQKGKFLIKYPSLKCSGEWKLKSFNQTEARFRETIKINRRACEPEGNVVIQRLKNNRILFIYSYLGETKTASKAILRKVY